MQLVSFLAFVELRSANARLIGATLPLGNPRAFRFPSKRENALSFCCYAIPDGKPLRTFPGIALVGLASTVAAHLRASRHR
ncbi:hypothetical protein FP026_05655 [Rhizobium tropici]|uniref:Uncharacterized protein n=1 Tax=Rhizobium tropici TaxID=398 RepID=A0A5B0WD61_RHITR|nr:hypothetical protein FP026_05655 [Rhizobium tropici]